jgi:hypothetical protein
MPEESEQVNEDQKVLTIESAETSEYFTIDVIDEDYARLRGNVRLNLQDGDTIHRISADEILFNRTRNIITARGRVIYEKIEDDSTETFRGESITVNIDSWAGVFLGGNSERKLESDGTAYLFSGTVIAHTEQDVTIINNARITTAGNEEALWSINASRLWLLPGSDFAIFNAILKVGEIPVLYIPFFFFPTDSLVFHPVIGYRSREGGFVQTTVYILGQPKADPAETSSISRILGNSNDMQVRRDGLFLRSTGQRVVNPNEISLKAMFDYYVNLGAYFGVELAVPRRGILNPIDFSLGLGFSRTLRQISTGFTPYTNDYDGTFEWNNSNLFSTQVPFRYRMRFSSSISARYGSLAWNFPFYSDPFIDRDFLNRSENMDWMNMLQQGAAIGEDAAAQTELSAYQWHMNGNINPSLRFLSPFISRISISNISTTLAFRTIRDDSVFATNPHAPERLFFAPNIFTIYSISGSITGAPLSLGGATPARPAAAPPAQVERDDPLRGIGVPISPWPSEEETTERERTTDTLAPPVLRQTFSAPRIGNTTFAIDYSISPTSSSELQFHTANWSSYDEVNWNEIQTVLSNVSGNSNINMRLNHSTGLFANTLTFTGTGTWRDYSFLNEDAFLFTQGPNQGQVNTPEIERLRRQQYSQTNYSTSYSYTGSLRPLVNSQIFGQTNLQYSFRGTLVRSRRWNAEDNPDGPQLEPQWGSWVKEETVDNEFIPGLNSHQLSANLAASLMNRNQTIAFSAALPPLDALYSTNATFNFWISTTNVNFRIRKPVDSSKPEEAEWIYDPINITETLTFPNIGSLVYHMVIDPKRFKDPEENFEITTIRTTLSLWNLRANFTATRTARFEFIENPAIGGRWEQIQGEDPALHPTRLEFSYSHSLRNIDIIAGRIRARFDISSSLTFDLQRYTNSNFQLTFGTTTNINNFLDLTISATSSNAVIWRYFKNVPGMEDYTWMYRADVHHPSQFNVFTDLLDSFNFFDEEKRRRTGFKMGRFNLSAVHHLGDWDATFSLNVYPFLDSTQAIPKHVVTADFSFVVQWKPISEIKSDIRYDGRNERWTVQ